MPLRMDSESLQQTYLRPSIHTTQNFKWSRYTLTTLNISQLQTFIYRGSTSTHYKTADTNIQHCIQFITNIPHSVLTGDVNAHSTLWHSYTDDHIGQTLCKLCQPLPPPSNGGSIIVFWASRPCGPAGWLAMHQIKAGDVKTNPGPITTRKQVWICDICHIQIQVRKQISIRCNRIDHWAPLRCAGIRLAQYTDTWTCHLHRESRLTTHTDITPHHPPRPWPKPPTNSPPTPPTPPQPKRHISHFSHVPPKLVKPKPNPVTHAPLIPPNPPRAKHR